MSIRRMLVLVLLILGSLVIVSVPVMACSGGPYIPTMSERLEKGFVVRGSVGMVDDFGQNAIFKVEEYLAGVPGPDHLLIRSASQDYLFRHLDYQHSSGECGQTVDILQSGQEMILFLSERQPDGSYWFSWESWALGAIIFDKDHPTTNIWEDIPHDANGSTRQQTSLTEDQLLQQIQEITGLPPSPPVRENYPLSAPLLVTTEYGTRYILPVDGLAPVRLTEDDPLLRDDGSCWSVPCSVWYHSYSTTGRRVLPPTENDTFLTNARAFSYSPSKDALAVWNKTEAGWSLDVTSLWLDRLGYRLEDYSGRKPVQASFPLVLSTSVQPAAWSPDGRLLAFSDDRGVWLWDVLFPGSVPEKIWSTPQTIQGFSPHGRFLVLGEPQTGFSLDLVNGATYPPGIFSDDERMLLTTEAAYRVLNVPAYYSDTTPEQFQKIGSDHYEQITRTVLKGVWEDNARYIYLSCRDTAHRETCFVSRSTWSDMYGGFAYLGFDFDYLADGKLLVVAQDGHTLFFDDRGRQYEITTDGWLDGAIASVEWLPSLFSTRR